MNDFEIGVYVIHFYSWDKKYPWEIW